MPGNDWMIYALKMQEQTTLQVKILNAEHSCGWSFDNPLAIVR